MNNYFLVKPVFGNEYILQYTDAELGEVFTPEQKSLLHTTGTVVIKGETWVDMVGAARALRRTPSYASRSTL